MALRCLLLRKTSSTPAVVPGAAPALAKAGVGGYMFYCICMCIYIYIIVKFMGVKHAIFQWSRLAQDLQEAPQGFGDPRTCGACGACG